MPDSSRSDEKQIDVASMTQNTADQTQGHHNLHLPFHHHNHRHHVLRHLIHPSGKHLHIVHHPNEVEPRRVQLAKDDTYGKYDYEIVIYGTPEHLSAIQDVQNHHLSRRASLKEKNAELFAEFDEVHETPDHLSDELRVLTERAVALDANFDKFGYHAQLRTISDIESSNINSNSNSDQSTKVDDSSGSSPAERRHKDRNVDPVRFWKTPTIRQYWHKGLLWRSARSGEVGTFELFTDLIYVGVIDSIGEVAVLHASADTFVRYCVVFLLAYKIWSDLTTTVNWFEVEDCVGRLAILFVLCCLLG